MTTIGLVADDQSLEVAVNPVITSGEENTVILHVDFSEDWNGFGKTAVFFTEKNKNTLYEKIMSGGECIVPSEVMVNEGAFLVGIRGVNSTSKQVKTTSLVKYKISKGTPAVEEFGPTPDVYEQLLTAYEKTDNSINKEISDRKSAISTEKTERQAEIAVERARIDNISTLTEGSTTADAELLDIRVKADGSTATSAGNAVREQITALKSDISDLKDNVVCELFEPNYNEIIVSDSEKMSNKVAYIYTDNTVRTYDNSNAYVLHKNVSGGDVYRISSQTHGSANTLLYAICDSDGQVVESQKMNVEPNTHIITNISIPNDGVEIYLNYFPATYKPLIVEKMDIYGDSLINGSENVCCWGDSLTRGVGVGDSYSKAFPYVLYGLLDGRKVINCGVGGENTINIASRQGGLPNIVQPFIIPSDETATEVTIKNIYGGECGILLQGGSALDPITGEYVITAQINPCTIAGVEGTLTYTSGKYYFARTNSGSSVTVTRPTVLITNAMKKLRSNINVIWIGTNGGFTTSSELIECIEAMINYMRPINKKYIVIGIHHLVSTVTETFEMIEKNMAMHFGRRYINQRKYMIEYGLSDAGITPTVEDTKAISQGKIPPSLLSDNVHYNYKGYNIIANLIAARGKELGYW